MGPAGQKSRQHFRDADAGEIRSSAPSGPRSAEEGALSWCRWGLNNQRKQQNNKNKITLWKPKEHCVQFAVVIYEKKKKKRERERRERQTPPWRRQIGTSAPHF